MHWLRHVLWALAAIFLTLTSALAQIGEQPIRFVFPFPPGGAGDALVRMLADSLRGTLGRPVIVENKAGAGGRIGVIAVKEAPSDGSVLLFTPIGPMALFPHLYDNLGYDPVADFTPIAQVATFDIGVAVGSAVPATSLGELVNWLRSSPDRASYGSPAAGSQPHFLGVRLGQMTKLDLRHIAYKGSPPAITDLIGGHLPAYFGPTPELVEGHKAGRIRILATSGAARSPVLADVPTFTEAGYDIQGEVWFGAYAPAKTPDALVARLNAAIVAAVGSPEIKTRMLALGLQPTGTSGAELGRIQLRDLERWRSMVKASGFKPTQ